VEIGIVTQRVIKGDGQGRVNFEIAREALKRGHRVLMIATEVAIMSWALTPTFRPPVEAFHEYSSM